MGGLCWKWIQHKTSAKSNYADQMIHYGNTEQEAAKEQQQHYSIYCILITSELSNSSKHGIEFLLLKHWVPRLVTLADYTFKK